MIRAVKGALGGSSVCFAAATRYPKEMSCLSNAREIFAMYILFTQHAQQSRTEASSPPVTTQ